MIYLKIVDTFSTLSTLAGVTIILLSWDINWKWWDKFLYRVFTKKLTQSLRRYCSKVLMNNSLVFLCTCKTNVFHYVGVLEIIFHHSPSKWRAFQKDITKRCLAPFSRPCGLSQDIHLSTQQNGRYKNQVVHTMSWQTWIRWNTW